ncbi:WD40 repeat-like protein [Phanerochaete sordida]|uniref:WD40 repeat-like protein n=1 Tax=Phanerochaete sordida TaxID=48140 RepID=A0A9P3FZ17_9APHY|nr:WD40 repeat-like protein [Phanerochaete sordida]
MSGLYFPGGGADDEQPIQLSYNDIVAAMLEIRRRAAARAGQGAAAQREQANVEANEEPINLEEDHDINRLLSELIRDGTVTIEADDDDDEYVPDEDGEEDEDMGMEIEEDEDEEEDEGNGLFGYRIVRDTRPQQTRLRWQEEVKEPKQEGLDLLYSGEFGRIQHQIRSRNKAGNAAKFLLNRGSRLRPPHREDFATDIIPNTDGTAVASYYANAYVGQYSSDSSFYYTCVRDFRLHVYDTTAPTMPRTPTARASRLRAGLLTHDHDSSMKVIKTIHAQPGGWTITDSHLSPDNQRMIYASVSNVVYMASTLDSSSVQVPINFADPPRPDGRYGYEDHYGVWSCKFSADGNEVIAGGTEMVFVYDLLADKRTVKIKAHEDDINSCCWADTASGNVLVSASDDTFLKVWDRRSLGSSPKPSGVLIGHTEGITYVSAKGDGRYVISNGKDQSLRLWDLRKMRSNLEFDQVKDKHFGITNFDYRRATYPKPKYQAHPNDCSVMQYTGHEVLRTLIRCHFSPADTTGQQYIYSGSADGRIHIWSLDGRVVQVLDRAGTLPMSFDPSEPQSTTQRQPYRKVCVRDVSWHSQQPIMMSAGWLGGGWGTNESSVIARHEWKGLSKMRYSLEDYVDQQNLERPERAARTQRRGATRAMPGTFRTETDEEE